MAERQRGMSTGAKVLGLAVILVVGWVVLYAPRENAPAPLSDRDRFATDAAEVAPLEASIQGLEGVVEVLHVGQVGNSVQVELIVSSNQKAQSLAELILTMVRARVDTVEDISVILDDGGIPIAYNWSGDAWSTVPLEAVATARAA